MRSNKLLWVGLLIMIGIPALAYLPLVGKFGYFNDDWYLMYDVGTQGPQFFHPIFAIDRPGRALLMIPLFHLFGMNPLPYNLTAFLFRVLGGLSLFWTLSILFHQRKFLVVTTTILFTIYPGFLSQHNAIDYQSHLFALFMALLSVALTLKSVLAKELRSQVLWAIGSIFVGWASLSQMEYFIGVETFRVACIFLLVWRDSQSNWLNILRRAILKWLPFVIIPVVFLIWRLLFFQSTREATDVSLQVGQLFSSPLTGLWWLMYLLQDIFNLLVVAWAVPLSMFVFPMRLQEQLIGLGLAVLAVLLFVFAIHRVMENGSETESGSSPRGMREELWLSSMSILGGVLPVILVNRHIILPDYSRYTLIPSVGAVLLLTALIERISLQWIRIAVTGFLIAIAVLTHYGNSVRAAAETESMRDFWWQVAWRAPGIKPGVTLVAEYPVGSIQEDYFVWGPANLIYYPEKQNVAPINIQLPAAVLTRDIISRILFNGGGDTQLRRGNFVFRSYGDILVLAQASDTSCVRILNGEMPDLSATDQERIKLVASHSNLNAIQVEGEVPILPTVVFGNEPVHDWCYYYQKADLARQLGNWDEVARLGDEAQKLNLHPNDQIEWMPFLQAYAVLDDLKQVKIMSTRMNTNFSYKYEACHNLTAMTTQGYKFSAEMQNRIDDLFCQ